METTTSILAFLPKLFKIVNHVTQRKYDVEKTQQMWQRETHLHCISGIKENILKSLETKERV